MTDRHPFSPEKEDIRLGPGGVVARRCSCRGWITAPETILPETVEAVVRHRASEQHRSYDWEGWKARNTEVRDVPVVIRKVEAA